MEPPVVVHGISRHGIPITIFGEIHNQVIQSFYEELDMKGKSLWVEHSTVFCSLQKEEHALFEKAKGGEWVWFTQHLQGKPVRCVDIRIELGLLSSIEEHRMRMVIEQMGESDEMVHQVVAYVIKVTMKTVSTITSLKKMLAPIMSDLKPILSNLRIRMDSILQKVQVRAFTNKNVQALYEESVEVHDDIVRLGSITLDAYLMHLFNDHDEKKPIYLFAGMNHAFRLAHWLGWTIEPYDSLVKRSIQLSALEPLESAKTIVKEIK